MTDWTGGYTTDIDYTFGYYPELNPARASLPLLAAGYRAPRITTACELGFGQGITVNMHAAASAIPWWGTDFNPSQTALAQELALVSGSGAKLFDQSFESFCQREDLPDFDFIGLHGIWSWISPENQSAIVDFLRRKLRVGGILYISYNAMPGWSGMTPIRNLMLAHNDTMGSAGQGSVDRFNQALAFVDKLIAVKPIFMLANPSVAAQIEKIKNKSRNYLVHEYFNREFHPMSFDAMSEWLSPAKLSYGCSANYLDHIDAINLTTDQQAFLKEIPDRQFRETVRDFCVNQKFRRDYWIKGPRRLSVVEQWELLRAFRVVLVTPRKDVSLKATGSLGEAAMQEAVYGPILDALADHKPLTLSQIEHAVKDKNIQFAQLLQAVMVLNGTGALSAAQDEKAISAAKMRTDKLNAFLCGRTAAGAETGRCLASPVTGGGLMVGRVPKLFLLAMRHGRKKPEELAGFAWPALKGQGQRMPKDGKALETDGENLAELTAQAEVFINSMLPKMKTLGIA